jgi:hypothetical protein
MKGGSSLAVVGFFVDKLLGGRPALPRVLMVPRNGTAGSAQRDSRLVLRLSWFVSAMRVAIRLPCIAPSGSHHCELLQMGRRGTVQSCAGRKRTRALAAHKANTGSKS